MVNDTTIRFLEARFPDDISYGATGGPQFSTSVVTSYSGHEQRNCNWEAGLARYNVAHGVKTDEQLFSLISFFRVCKGRAMAFRFKDWMDYKAVKQQVVLGNGSTKYFLLYATYTYGGAIGKRRIYKPVTGTLQLYNERRNLLPIEYKVDYKIGAIELAIPPDEEEILYADFEFDIPARFDTDHLIATKDNFGLSSWQDIPIIEIRLPSTGNSAPIVLDQLNDAEE